MNPVLMDLRHRYLAGDIDTEQYLLQVDAMRHIQRRQMKTRMIFAGIAVVGGGALLFFLPSRPAYLCFSGLWPGWSLSPQRVCLRNVEPVHKKPMHARCRSHLA